MTTPFIVTASGVLFPLLKPEPQLVRLRDISRHLAKINRFSGATRECYSVAQHCLHVCELLEKRKASFLLQLHGLLHDAHEAYSGDITRPMKMAMKANGNPCRLADIEDDIQFAIFQAFDMTAPLQLSEFSKIEAADTDLLATEFRDLMPESDFKPTGTPASFRIKPMLWDVAEQRFLKKFHDLISLIGLTPMHGVFL